MTKHWIDTNDVALRYELSGSGDTTLVLVHEMGGTLDSWDHVLPSLQKFFRVLRYDTRGAGQSEKANGTLTFDIMAADLLGLLDALQITEPVALAGCAVGAGIAITFAGTYPARTKALVAMAPATGMPANRRDAIMQLAAQVERDGMRAIVDTSFAGSYPSEVRYDAAHYESFRARWLANDPRSYAAIYRMLAHAEMADAIAAIMCPALVIAGIHDRLRPPPTVEPIAKALNAPMKVLATGHFMATQTPGLVAQEITAFLQERR